MNPVQTAVQRMLQRLPRQSRTILLTCAFGLAGGFAAVAFQLAIHAVYGAGIVRLAQQDLPVLLIGSFVLVIGSSAAVGWLLHKYCPEAAGSGIPQLKVAFWKEFGWVPFRVVWVKFLAALLSIGGGSSLGREGPSVQIAGAVGSNLAGLAGEAKQSRRPAAAAGAAAGLAAAFNTPLAAITFVLEEIIGDLNSRMLGSVLLASVLGALVVHGCVGKQPAFEIMEVQAPSWAAYLLCPIVASLASLVGIYFQRCALQLRARIRRSSFQAAWLWPCLGGFITWILGISIFVITGRLGIFSLGYEDLSDALAGRLDWQLAIALLAGKFVATFACYGFGGCGGIFSPTLFFGGMTGAAVAGFVNWALGAAGFAFALSEGDQLTLAVVGMSATLGAVVWAPVTGILIVFEMTHEFGLVPVLMVTALVSQTISRRMNKANFYDTLIEQDGHRIEQARPPRDLHSWQQFPVSTLMNFRPVVVTELSPTDLRKTLQAHPYRRFPVVQSEQVRGILTREEAMAAMESNREPKLAEASYCQPGDTLRQLQTALVQSPHGIILVVDVPGGRLLGIVTLHDVLRAEMALGRSADG